jgi:hypothetical protein
VANVGHCTHFSGGGDRGLFALQILLSSFLQHISVSAHYSKINRRSISFTKCAANFLMRALPIGAKCFDARRLLIHKLPITVIQLYWPETETDDGKG